MNVMPKNPVNRLYLFISAILLFLITIPVIARQRRPIDLSGPKPNILIIPIDGIGTYVHCYGDPMARTPNIDKLAAQGVRYEDAFTAAGVCAPSRAAFITGMYPPSIGAQHMRTTYKYFHTNGLPVPYLTVPPPYVKGFTEYLRAHGYYVTNNNATDWQFTGPNPAGAPFTLFDKSGRGVDWESRQDKNQPFCSIIGLWQAHEHENWNPPHHTDPSKVTVPPYYPDTPEVRSEIASAYDNIATADSVVGVIMAKLLKDGLDKNTIVILWSDHGEGFPRAKRWLYEAGIHVPLIIRWPGHIKPGTVSRRMVSMVDLAPTILSMAGIPIPVHMQGKAFLGPQAQAPRKYIYADRDRIDNSYDMVRAVRDRKYEYIQNFYTNTDYVQWVPYRNNNQIMKVMLKYFAEGKLKGPQKLMFVHTRFPQELYDVPKDHYEIDNLAYNTSYDSVVSRMKTVLTAWRTRIGDEGKIPETQMVNRMWPNHVQPTTTTPDFIPNSQTDREFHSADDGGIFPAPVTLRIYCSTQGASIGYTFEKGPNPHWNLYTSPFKLPEGVTTVRTKAIRYGYKESSERTAMFRVVPAKTFRQLTAGKNKK